MQNELDEITKNKEESLVEAHRRLIRSSAGEQDNHSLAQPSPLRYVPSRATDRTSTPATRERHS